MTHLMNVAGIVSDYAGTEDQVIAALLHDAVEDQGGHETLEIIRERFGETVANYVDGCTDAYVEPKPPWRERKETFLDKTRHAPWENRLIIAADKLHNMRSMIRDHRLVGETLWDRFSKPKVDTLWYHAAVTEALGDGWGHPILQELRETAVVLQGLEGE
jgi:GTP pyrophosphokinase